MNVLDGVDERQLVVETWLQLSLEFLEPMKEQSILLWHNNSNTEILPVVFADSLRVVLFTLAIVAQVVVLRE